MKKKCLILTSIPIIAFIILALNLNNPLIISLDNSVSAWILNNQNQYLINFSKIIATLFDTIPMIIISLIIALAIYLKSKPKEAFYFASASIIAGALIYTLKEIIARPRPILQTIQETSFAFPSGHSTISAVFFGFMILFSLNHIKNITHKKLAIITSILLIAIVGITRIYLNVHWLTDVIGGYLLGTIIVLTLACFYKKH